MGASRPRERGGHDTTWRVFAHTVMGCHRTTFAPIAAPTQVEGHRQALLPIVPPHTRDRWS